MAASHVVVGGGVNGLSVAWRLAERGADVLVLDKGRVGGGATGSAGGIVRNYYRSPRRSPSSSRCRWRSSSPSPTPTASARSATSRRCPQRQVDDLVAIREQHARAGYASELVLGAERCREYLTWTWSDWEAPVEAILHERRGGWADAMQTVRHLADRARGAGAEIREGVEVVGFELGDDGVSAIATSEGRLECETVVVAPGPWIAGVWAMLGLSPEVEVAGERRPLVSYWKAQEGEFALRGVGLGGAGPDPPVVHLDQSEPLRSDRDGRALVPGAWGIYFRMRPRRHHRRRAADPPHRSRARPLRLREPRAPRGASVRRVLHLRPGHGAATLPRDAGEWRSTPGGGIVPHTPDNYPVCDWVLPNVYAIVDSGHGFKTLAIGRLAADDILDDGEPLLEAFRLGRFAQGATHAASKGPYPWT